MRVLGLTGSIATGKSTAAAALRGLGVPVFDADAAVAQLLAPGGAAVPVVAARYPDVITTAGGVDRQALGQRVFADRSELAWLEGVLHPRVQAQERAFLFHCAMRRARVVVLDIPLLFETGADRRVDGVLVVTCPPFLQRQRLWRRSGMTAAKMQAILARQMPDREKRRRGDIVIPTGLGRAVMRRRLRRAVGDLSWTRARAWPPRSDRPRRPRS